MCTANNATHQIGVYSSVPQEYNILKIVSVRDIVYALYCWGWAGGLLCAPPLSTSTKCLVLVVLLGDFLRKAISSMLHCVSRLRKLGIVNQIGIAVELGHIGTVHNA